MLKSPPIWSHLLILAISLLHKIVYAWFFYKRTAQISNHGLFLLEMSTICLQFERDHSNSVDFSLSTHLGSVQYFFNSEREFITFCNSRSFTHNQYKLTFDKIRFAKFLLEKCLVYPQRYKVILTFLACWSNVFDTLSNIHHITNWK